MSEQEKNKGQEAEQTAPEAPETAEPPREEPEAASEKGKAKKKKEKGITFTREQVEQMEAAAKQLETMKDQFTRLAAEYDNYRRRSQKEKESLYADVKIEAVKSFLPVYDNLERALAQSTEDEAYRKGVEMIMTQFNSTLTKLGVAPIDSLGEKFDPQLHNAVMHTDDAEKGENEIVEVFQQGFKLGDKVIRFAMVKVAN